MSDARRKAETERVPSFEIKKVLKMKKDQPQASTCVKSRLFLLYKKHFRRHGDKIKRKGL